MNLDRLYELAFEYRKTKLWEKLADDQIFAVRMSDGEVGYVCIMGRAGTFNGLNVYMGEQFECWDRMRKYDPYLAETDFEEIEMLTSQDCIQVELTGKQDLEESDLSQVTAYARKHKIKLTGKYAYPSFHRYCPTHIPWKIEDEKDAQHLAEAIEAAIALGKLLPSVEIKHYKSGRKTVFAMDYADGHYVQGKRCHIPAKSETKYPIVDAVRLDQMSLHKVKKLRKKDIIECGLVLMPTPVQKSPESAPYYPYILMAIAQKTGRILEFIPITREEYIRNPEILLNQLLQAMLKEGVKASSFLCQDARTAALMEELAVQFGIESREEVFLEALEDAQDSLLEYLDYGEEKDGDVDPEDYWDDEYDEEWEEEADDWEEDADELFSMLLDMILSLPKKEVKKLPKEMLDAAKILIAEGDMPRDIKRKLKQKLDM